MVRRISNCVIRAAHCCRTYTGRRCADAEARLDAVERRLLALEGDIVQLDDLGFYERRIDDLETAVYGSYITLNIYV